MLHNGSTRAGTLGFLFGRGCSRFSEVQESTDENSSENDSMSVLHYEMLNLLDYVRQVMRRGSMVWSLLMVRASVSLRAALFIISNKNWLSLILLWGNWYGFNS